jgi:DNA-binding IclR family transcriptional regulator
MFRVEETVPKSDVYTLDSATNALRLIGLLGERGTITVTEVSNELNVGKSTAHRLLATLVAEDYATRDPVHRRYHAGRALVGAGLSALGELDVRRRAFHPLRQLAVQTGETCKVLILEGLFARVIDTAETPQSLRVGGSIGDLLPANATAGGKLLLSGESEESIRERFGKRLPSLTANTISDWDDLMVELQRIRERGWASNVGESTPGVVGLAVPVQGKSVPTVAVITLAAPAERLPRSHYVRTVSLMFEAARQMRNAQRTPRGPIPKAEAMTLSGA